MQHKQFLVRLDSTFKFTRPKLELLLAKFFHQNVIVNTDSETWNCDATLNKQKEYAVRQYLKRFGYNVSMSEKSVNNN